MKLSPPLGSLSSLLFCFTTFFFGRHSDAFPYVRAPQCFFFPNSTRFLSFFHTTAPGERYRSPPVFRPNRRVFFTRFVKAPSLRQQKGTVNLPFFLPSRPHFGSHTVLPLCHQVSRYYTLRLLEPSNVVKLFSKNPSDVAPPTPRNSLHPSCLCCRVGT